MTLLCFALLRNGFVYCVLSYAGCVTGGQADKLNEFAGPEQISRNITITFLNFPPLQTVVGMWQT